MPTAARPKRRHLLLKFAVLPALLLIAAVAYVCFTRSALDRAIAAYHAAHEPILPEDFPDPHLPDKDNAATYLAQAFAAQSNLAPEPTILALLQKAESAPALHWPGPPLSTPGPAMAAGLARIEASRTLALSLSTSATTAHTAHHDAAALARVHDILFLARATDTDSLLVSHLTADGITGLACQTVDTDLAPILRAADPGADPDTDAAAMKVIADLLDDASRRAAITSTFRHERAYVLQSFRPNTIASPLPALRVVDTVRAADLAENFPAAQPILFTLPTTASAWSPAQAMARQTALGLQQSVTTDFRTLTDRRLAAVTLAIALYRNDHADEFPPTLQALVPHYLPTLPTDPFAPKPQPFHYTLTPAPALYSVYTNAADDHGATDPKNPWNGPDYVVPLTRPATDHGNPTPTP